MPGSEERFIKTVKLMAKRRIVPRKGQTSIEKAAGFYQSCLNTSRHTLREAHSLKKSLQICGIYWPILDATSDLLDILFCTALDFYWPVLLIVTSKDSINFVIEPSQYYEQALERREEMLVAQKYNLYYDTMHGYFMDYMNPIATPAVLADLSDVTRTIRGSFQAALASSWIEAKGGTEVDDSATDPSLVLFQLVKLDTLNSYYSEFPDMTDSLYANIERVPYSQGNRRSPVNILSFERNGVVRLYNATPEGFVLYPNALEMPLYGVDVPPIIKNAALGFVIALAISTSIFENWTYWNASSKVRLVSRAACFIGENLTAEEIDSSHMDLIIRVAALRVLWRTVNLTDTVDEALVLRGLEHLSERQLFFAAWCFMHCGQKKVTDQCNRPLRQLDAFSEVFSCSAKSSMGAPSECPLF
ncbi:hypothetical protein HPB47_028230 [Ixodes persulcatus]|uniref:Uncharacterized protein n=1 Tax=Ixodes persulcatus TaxID=34615 RepID=A0AC60PU36_IXOPE|nr:hypothetical protein HPB47_028230 [Ixodes persulcatus]